MSLVSLREALFSMYVPVKCCLFFALGSHEHTAQTYSWQTTDKNAQGTTLQRCRTYAVRVPHTHMRFTAVAGCVYRSLRSIIHHLPLFAAALLYVWQIHAQSGRKCKDRLDSL